MRSLFVGCVAVVLALGVAGEAGAKCSDDAAVALARMQVAALCPCDGFANHGQYVKCARGVANTLAGSGTLPNSCKGSVISCAAKSTCGKPGFVTCCTTDARGRTKCSIKKGADKCKAPRGGSSCVGFLSSCCDACGDGGCFPPPTPTPTVVPPTPTPTPVVTPTPTPPYGSASRAFVRPVTSLLQ